LGLAAGLSLLAGATASAAEPLPGQAPDRIAVQRRNKVLELSWSDTEERLQGAIQPDQPVEGQPLKVLLNVGSFEGATFEGPLTITLREAGATHGQVQTVKKGAVNWVATFTPETDGPYQLDVSFRTTHLKVLHANLEVASSPVPRFVLWTMVGLTALSALGYGLWSLLRKDTSTPEGSSPAGASAADPTSAPEVTDEKAPKL
jgi:hypothetical protein